MGAVIISGSSGLIGSCVARHLADQGVDVVGIDNDMRRYFFGPDGSTVDVRNLLCRELDRFTHENVDIRDQDAIERIFSERSGDIVGVVHAAAQPSHDWAAEEPMTDFGVNANGTLVMLEAARKHAPEAGFVYP